MLKQPTNIDSTQSDHLSIAIAGTTVHTVMCAEVLSQDKRFTISWVLTPSPRLIGRKQLLTKNPVHVWAEKNNIPVVLIDKKIDENVRANIEHSAKKPCDFLLVVDFGYIVPNWLLSLPQISPINIHPSDLPKYRGSSPGQFVLLYGDIKSAVSVIRMNELLDQGDLIHQTYFEVLSTWISSEYYQNAFTLISEQLPNILTDFASKKIVAKQQPIESPTPIARRFTREDGYVSWQLFSEILESKNEQFSTSALPNSPLLNEVNKTLNDWPQTIANAIRALSPWPGVWTIVPTIKGEKRMKILSVEMKGGKLELEKVQIEGQNKDFFAKVINQIQ